jgi:predicted dehydrogenase
VKTDPLKIGLVGCGAIAELAHEPALRTLVAERRVTLAAAIDPDARRRERVAAAFPGARALADLDALRAGEIDLAIVASPVRWHAPQTISLLGRGVHVLCEKPLAASAGEAAAMAAAARDAGRVLAAGQFRRFFPALRAVRELVVTGVFGALGRFTVQEGGAFDWPAATPSFFDPQQAGGGVLLDLGVHVLDTLAWWLGEPLELDYADDAAGGLEANCRMELRFAGGATGAILLSRDAATRQCWELEFERAQVVWRAGRCNELEIRLAGSSLWQVSRFEGDGLAGRRAAVASAGEVFHAQLEDVVRAVAENRPPEVPGEAALPALRAIERAYAARAWLECPWMSEREQAAARAARRTG